MTSLAECSISEKATVAGVSGERMARRKLLDMGLVPGTTVEVRRLAPLGDPVEILVRGTVLSLRKDEACMVQVERDSAQKDIPTNTQAAASGDTWFDKAAEPAHTGTTTTTTTTPAPATAHACSNPEYSVCALCSAACAKRVGERRG